MTPKNTHNLFDGDYWRCPFDDCDGYVTGEFGRPIGEKIDEHLALHHDTTLEEYAEEEVPENVLKMHNALGEE